MSIRGPASQSMPPRSDAVSPESGLPIQVRRDVHATGLKGSPSLNFRAAGQSFAPSPTPYTALKSLALGRAMNGQ